MTQKSLNKGRIKKIKATLVLGLNPNKNCLWFYCPVCNLKLERFISSDSVIDDYGKCGHCGKEFIIESYNIDPLHTVKL